MDTFLGCMMGVALLGLYFTPTISAAWNEHPHTASIFLIHVFLGWTLLGWVICLAWSVSRDH